MKKEFFLFCFVGVLNTAVSLFIYQIAIFFVPYWISYTLSYFGGVLCSYLGNSHLSFKVAISLRRLIEYSLFYFLCYLIGLSLTICGVSLFHVHERLIPFLVVPLMLPINFFGSRYILYRSHTQNL